MELYDIQIIQPDLRHEETIVQIANAFNLLQQVITEVFDKVDDRIKLNCKAVQDIDTRIDRINKKIDELANDYESIDIQSPYNYPPQQIFKNIPMTLTQSNRKPINFNRQYNIKSGPDSNISKTYEKKLQFYYVRQPKSSTSSTSGSVSSKEAVSYMESGLGTIPPYVDSINALLLFNKSENVFDKKQQKNLRRLEQSAHRHYDPILSDGPSEMEKAPQSITTRQLLNMRIRKNLFMATQWNDDEQIDIPIMLPDVSGIRDKKKKRIVKSEEKLNEKIISEEPKVIQTESVARVEPVTTKSPTQSETSSSTVVDSAPTPPPVPPPITSSEIVTPKAPGPKLNSNTLDRSSLMEAIRQAGGAQKMKKKVNVPQEDNKEKTEKTKQPVTFSSGGLMDDLHKKLALRRKGISGNKDPAQGSNVMDGISAMIPPPPPKQSGSSSESESNDDWN